MGNKILIESVCEIFDLKFMLQNKKKRNTTGVWCMEVEERDD